MAELTTVARPYAKAAFEHAQANGQLAAWSSMLALAAAVVDDAAFKQYIARPTLSGDRQRISVGGTLVSGMTSKANTIALEGSAYLTLSLNDKNKVEYKLPKARK